MIAEGAVERIGLSGGWLWLKDGQGKRLADSHSDFSDHKEAVKTSGVMRPSDIIAKMRNPGPE